MPARDKVHDIVKNALIKDGWTITDDPLTLKFGNTSPLRKPLFDRKIVQSLNL